MLLLEPKADAYVHPQGPSKTSKTSKTETYLKVTALTVAPSGWFLHHLPSSSDMDGCRIWTCIMGGLTGRFTIG
jgi:hypothetical protein